jgi:DNA-binding CsgD family transcriptional regulator
MGRKEFNKCVCCNRSISQESYTCNRCAKDHGIIGKPYKDWPEWLKFLIRDTRRESYDVTKSYEVDLSFTDMGWDNSGDDEEYYSEDITNNLWDDVDGAIDSELELDRLLEVLTPRETEVLHMLMDGYNDEEIAVRLELNRQNINYFHKEIQKKASSLGINRF